MTLLRAGRPLQLLGLLALLVAVFLMFLASPTRAAVNATVGPSTNLNGTDTVHVHATGLPGSSAIQVLECKADAIDSTRCAAVTTDDSGFSDNNGNFDLDYGVQMLPNSTFPQPTIRCNGVDNDCALFVGKDYNNFSLPKTLVPISFSSTATTSVTTGTTTTTTTGGTTTTTTGGSTTTTTTKPGSTTTTTKPGSTTTTTGSDASTSTATSTSLPGTTTTVAGSTGGISASSSQQSSSTGSSGSGSGSPAAASSTTTVTAASDGAPTAAAAATDPSVDANLPRTGAPSAAPWLALAGVVLLVAGSGARRAALMRPPLSR